VTVSANYGISGQQGQQTTTGYDAFGSLNLDTFIKLLVVELQNQDPLNPMDNAQILNQISQIRQIESTSRLTSTLDAVRLGQDLATASSMVGRNIMALSDAGELVTGTVEWVSIEMTGPKLHLGDHVVSLGNVSMILPDDSQWRSGDEPVVIPPQGEVPTGDPADGTIPPGDDDGDIGDDP
jgi:flagellar hook assembly protein FlgD